MTLDNSGSEGPVTFEVNGDEVVVPAGETDTVELPAVEDTDVPVLVTAGEATLVDTVIEVDCESVLPEVVEKPVTPSIPVITPAPTGPTVLPDTVVQPTSLPRTGSGTLEMAVAGLSVLLLGAGMVLVGRTGTRQTT